MDRLKVSRRGRGSWAEGEAARFLGAKGYRIVESNFFSRRGEIDLIVEKAEELVFVEVRYRGAEGFGVPGESVGRSKRRRLILAAKAYLMIRGEMERPCRFDIVSLQRTKEGSLRIEHWPNAFDRNGRPTGSWSGG